MPYPSEQKPCAGDLSLNHHVETVTIGHLVVRLIAINATLLL